MEVMTRKQALAAGLNSYFTGKPCLNGHVAERYTPSGACKECLAEAQRGVRRPRGHERTPERTAQLEGLVMMRLRAVPADEATLLDTVAALTVARRPLLHAADVVGARQGTKPAGGTLLYHVNVDPLDMPMIKDVERALRLARAPDIQAIRAAAFGGVMAQAEAARDNGEGEWKFT
jgi:hypothetical protein